MTQKADENRHLLEIDERRFAAESPPPPPLSLSYKLLRLFVQFLIWCMIGSFSEVIGPVLPELIAQTGESYEVLLQAVSMRGVGHISGGILGALLIDPLLPHIDMFGVVITGLYVILGITVAYLRSIEVMFVALLLQGTLETMANIVGYRVVFIAFREKSAAACNVIQFGYYLGGTLAPAIAKPFVDGRYSGLHISLSGELTHTDISTNQTSLHVDDFVKHQSYNYPARFVTAFWIVAGSGLLALLIQLGFHIYTRKSGVNLANYLEVKVKATVREQFSFRTCSPSHPVLAGLFLVMMFFHIGCNFTLTRVFPKVIFSYDREGPRFSVGMSSLMTSSFFLSSLVGIPFFLIPSSFVHVKYLLQTQATLMLVVSILLYFLYLDTTVLWVLFILLGFVSGPCIASGFGMVNHYIEMTSVAQMVPQIGAAVADFIVMYAVGYSFDHYGPYSIWAHLLVLCIIIFIVSTIMLILGYLHGDRYAIEETDSERNRD